MPTQPDHDLKLLRYMLALRPAGWTDASSTTRFPRELRRFLDQADTPMLECLLIETIRRLNAAAPAPASAPALSRAGLHEAIQAELRHMQPPRRSRPSTRLS